MKKLVLSAVLGMFCYCTNNAMNPEPQSENPKSEENKEIKDILTVMLQYQVEINKAREEIKEYEKKIYFQISEEKKVKKEKVLGFIINRFTEDEQKEKGFKDDINKIEQYFHLEEIKEDNECTKENLTEIFWEKVETITEEDEKEIVSEGEQKIKKYFQTIIGAEKAISEDFKKYYDAKKKASKEAQYEDILKEIMKDCCGEETNNDIQTNFLNNLIKLCTEKSIENKDNSIIAAIKRRITLANNAGEYENDFMYFLKQKIGEEKKENNPGSGEGGKPAEEECCPCC